MGPEADIASIRCRPQAVLSYFVPMSRPKYHADAEHVAAESAVLAATAVEIRATSDS